MKSRLDLQLERQRIAELEDALERTRLRRFAAPVALGLAVALAIPMWGAIVPGPLTTGNLGWMAVCGVLAMGGLVANEVRCRRRIRTLIDELAPGAEPRERLRGDSPESKEADS